MKCSKSKKQNIFFLVFAIVGVVFILTPCFFTASACLSKAEAMISPSLQTSTFDASIKSDFDQSKIVIDTAQLRYNQKGQVYPVSYNDPTLSGHVSVTYSRDNETFYTAEEIRDLFVDTAKTYTVYYKLSHADFNDTVGSYQMTILKAERPVLDTTKLSIKNNAKVLSDVSLPDGWAWVVPTTPIKTGTQKVSANYVGEDQDNYEETTVDVSLTISKKQETKTNPWQIVIYIMIPINVVLTILYILYMRKRKFKKKYLEQ